ncbi:hypothetical protein FKM82_013131 [Ascaphus truei]
MQNHDATELPELELLVTGSSPSTSVSVTINKSDFRKDITVGKGETVSVPITAPVELQGTGIFPSSVVIKADADITVVSRNYKYASSDTALLYPVHQLGLQYYIVTPPWGPESQYKEFSVVTYKNPNTVDIYLKGAVNLKGVKYAPGSKLTLALQPFQAVQIQSKDDLSGTKVVAKYPVAVLTGHTCSMKNGECDHVYEQLLPVASWGTTFFVPGLSFQPKSDIAFVVASQDTCLDYHSGTKKGNRNITTGEVTQFEVNVATPLSIIASEKIQVLLYGTGGTFKDKTFDPFLTNIPDTGKFGYTYEIIGQNKFNTNLAIILTKTSKESGITFDGKASGKIQWRRFPATEYSWGEYDYGSGFSTHIVENLKFPFGLLSIGFSERIGYGSVAPCISGPGAPVTIPTAPPTEMPIGLPSAWPAGKEFITTFMQNADPKTPGEFTLLITGHHGDTLVTVTDPKSDFLKKVSVNEQETVVVRIPVNVETVGSKPSAYSIIIKADKDISIESRNFKPFSEGTALMFPLQELGTEYYILTPAGEPKGSEGYKEFSIISYKDITKVDIFLKGEVTYLSKKYPTGSNLKLTLQPFETIQLQSKDDLSGTRVVAQNPVAVLSGHTYYIENSASDHVAEQLRPVSSWGKIFLVPPLSFQSNADVAQVVASKKTKVYYQSGPNKGTLTLEAGEVMRFEVRESDPLYISAEYGIQVVFYFTGGIVDGKEFDPFMIDIPDSSKYGTSYKVSGHEKIENNMFIIVAETLSTTGILFDGMPLGKIEWRPMIGTAYSWGEYSFGSGYSSHTIEHPNTPFLILSIGVSEKIGYGSPAVCTGGIGSPSALKPIPESEVPSETEIAETYPTTGPVKIRGSPQGMEFITVFMQNHNPKEIPQLELLVTGTSPSTSVSVTINKSNFKKDVKVGKGETVKIPITEPIELHGSGTSPSSVTIKADADVTVISRNYKPASADTALLYPVHELGTEYYVITPPWGPDSEYTEFSVVTYKYPSKVEILLKGAVKVLGKDYKPGSKIELTLEPFQAIQIQSRNDLSGTKVIAQRPVAVLSGHTCSQKNGACDHVYEQLLPVDSWGTKFLIPALSFQPKNDVAFVGASQDTFIDYQSGSQTGKKHLEDGDVAQFEISTSKPLTIQASDKVQILFYSTGGAIKNKSFNSFLTNIPDMDKYGLTYEIIGQEKFDTNIAVILAKTSEGPRTTFDGKTLKEIQWTAFPGTEYSWGEYSFGSGFSSHIMENRNSPFGLLSIGNSDQVGYGSVAACIGGFGSLSTKPPVEKHRGIPSGWPTGMEFVTSFMQNDNAKVPGDFTLLITGVYPETMVIITVQKSAFRKVVTVGERETIVVTIALNVEIIGSKTSTSSVVIKANKEISVESRNFKPFSEGTSLMYPSHELGTEYYILTPAGEPKGLRGYKEFSIINYHDASLVTIYLRGGVTYLGRVYPAGSKLSLKLKPFEVVQLQSKDDLSGTRVVTQNPVAVLSGHVCYKEHTDCDHVTEQLRPVSMWGSTFVVPPLSFQSNADVVLVVASQNTQIDYQSGTTKESRTVKAGEVITFEVQSTSPLYISAGAGLQVAFYSTGGILNGKKFDPFMINIPDRSKFGTSYKINGHKDIDNNMAIIVAETFSASGITFDGKPMDNMQWRAMIGTPYSWGEINYGRGFSSHIVEHPHAPFLLLNIGISERIGYGSPAVCTGGIQSPATLQPRPPIEDLTDTHLYGLLGKQFITACLQNNDEKTQAKLQLTISSYSATTSVTVVTGNGSFRKDLTLGQGETVLVEIDKPVEMMGTGTSKSSVIVKSNKPISMVALNYEKNTADTTIVYPVHELGLEYYIITPPWGDKNNYKEFAVTAYETTTLVDIYLKGAVTFKGTNYAAGSKMTITLEPFQVIQIQSQEDLSGTRLVAQNPVAVLSGSTNSKKNNAFGHISEQLLPISRWGRTFIIPPLSFQSNNDVVFVVASQDTQVDFKSGEKKWSQKLEKGKVAQIEVKVTSPLYFDATAGVQVMYYSAGGTFKGKTFNPFLMNIPDIASFGNAYKVTGYPNIENNYAILIAKKAWLSGIVFDGKPFPVDVIWKEIQGSPYSWTEYNFGSGFSFHNIEHPITPFGALSIGFGDHISYGSPAVSTRGYEVTCWGSGGIHYHTFDGLDYNFHGSCSYTLVTTLGKADVPAFSVEVNKENLGKTLLSPFQSITVRAYGFTITLHRSEVGLARVNEKKLNLPINLNGGLLKIYQSGTYAVVETHFRVNVWYDWSSNFAIQIPNGFSNSVGGLCGSFNTYWRDDFQTPDGKIVAKASEFGKSWKVNVTNNNCFDECQGECKACSAELTKKYEAEDFCGLLVKVNGPFSLCHAVIDVKVYLDICVYDICANDGYRQTLVQSLKAYADACQREGVSIREWRLIIGFSLVCPENSQYQLCGNACPTTCLEPKGPAECQQLCVETCQCNTGFVLSKGSCIPLDRCGCIFKGQQYSPDEEFWADDNCQERCRCNALTKTVTCKVYRCLTECSIKNGLRDCYSTSYGMCSASGDPHYVTFDGRRYNFQGTCLYTLSALAFKNLDLDDFQVLVQNEHRGSNVIAKTKSVSVKTYGVDITINREYPGKIKVNELLVNLPYNFDHGKITAYRKGAGVIVHTDFQVTVTFDWDNLVTVTLPTSYAGAVNGLCGNFNGKPEDDFKTATTPAAFGELWLVSDLPGCVNDQGAVCAELAAVEKEHRAGQGKCGLILDKKGPFRNCHHIYEPEGFFMDCVYDSCFYKGRFSVIGQALSVYATTCQRAGVIIYSWRTEWFTLSCPTNSHYELCSQGCPTTCSGLQPPSGCDPQCVESCVCDDGFILSGSECIPISQCGGRYRGIYYTVGEVFYPSDTCQEQCICRNGGRMECTSFSCGPNEECKIKDGVRKCFATGFAVCLVSGGSHYFTFDGFAFDFQGTCTYTLAKSNEQEKRITPFVVNVQSEKSESDIIPVTKKVEVTAYATTLTITQNQPGIIKVDEALYDLPINLMDGRLRAYQHGTGVTVLTDFGLQVTYDLVYHITVTLPSSFKAHLEGLCGNYNGNKNDEFHLPDGKVAPNATSFGLFWKTPENKQPCTDECTKDCPVPLKEKLEIYQKDDYCGILKSSNGPFKACYSIISPDVFFNNCVFDLAISKGARMILCASVQSYVADCQSAGVIVQKWRTDSYCALSCPKHSSYKMCADTCTGSCSGITDKAICPKTCAEGCQCDGGYLFDGQHCVGVESCGCFQGGIYYKPKQMLVRNQCAETCSCDPIKGVSCKSLKCGVDEECEVKDGVRGCHKDPCRHVKCRVKEDCQVKNGKGVCVHKYMGTCWGWGDPHYTTFDGYKFDLQGTCTYVLVKYSGNETGLTPFSIDEKNENRGNKVVAYVRLVNIDVYGHRISIVKGEISKVRVDGVTVNIPVSLDGGKVNIVQSGKTALIITDFGLRASYDWNWHVIVKLPSSYHGTTTGLCGNFNGNRLDDMITKDNKPASSIIEWAKSWKVNDQDPFCFDSCTGSCMSCNEKKKHQYTGENSCGLITASNGPFNKCQTGIDSDNFFSSCVYDVCINGGAKVFLCKALDAYATTCKDQGFEVLNWREKSSCPLPCPANSHYEACGNACTATCSDPTAADRCTDPCVETCQCNKGYVLSVDKCVPAKSCGCNHNGLYYQPNEEFWADESCSMYCRCDPGSGKMVCKGKKCKPSEKCTVVNGIRGCHPSSYSICTASGDPHYTTFDGRKFDFMGKCIYQLVKVTSTDPSLTPFTVTVQNDVRGNKAVSFTKVVTLEVYNQTISASKDNRWQIQVNGIQTNLPYYYEMNKIMAYIRGLHVYIKTDFDVTVTFDWNSYAKVILPLSYRNAVSGLCGNNNQDPTDDFIMSNGAKAKRETEFANHWKVGGLPDCTKGCEGNCPTCKEENKEKYKSVEYCGIITKTNGPFINCHASINPEPYFNDCVFDTCYFEGQSFAFSSAISIYVSVCQAAGILIQEWRSATFARLLCPPNSHYELCGTGCAPTCYDLSSPVACEPSCTEGCYCNSGFILSGGNCVPLDQCGALYKGIYYEVGEKLYTDDTCTEWCEFRENGQFSCRNMTCSPNELCKVVNGVRGCQSATCSKCRAEGVHYVSFDGLAYDFQGTCSYTLATVSSKDPRLVKFSVAVTNEKDEAAQLIVQRTVKISVYGHEFTMERGKKWEVSVDMKTYRLPLNYPDKKVWINQEGNNIILQTDFGLKVLYDTEYLIIVQMSGSYSNNLHGLCGNFNDDLTDELMLPDASVTKNVEKFGAAWKVPVQGIACLDGCGVTCPVVDPIKTAEYTKETRCGILMSKSGPFNGCFAKANPLRHFKNCVYDMSISADENLLCRNLQAYVSSCQAAGGEVKTWRSDTFCPLSCENSGQYNLCMNTCDQTCAQVGVPYSCTSRCFEGCKCLDGEYFDGNKCVPIGKCGCVNEGQYMQVEDVIVSSDCSERCTCQTGGALACEMLTCSGDESCSVRNGQRGCFVSEANCTISTKSVVSTFDSFSLPISVNGPYEVSSICSKDSPNWFKVLQVPDLSFNEPSVYVFFNKTYVASNLDKAAWVEGSPVKLPITVTGGITLSISGEDLVIKQTGGVKVMVNTSGEVTIKVPDSLANRLCGPCGNFNGISADDDIQSTEDQKPTTISEIIKQWKAGI